MSGLFRSFTPARFSDLPRLAPPALLIGVLAVLATAGFGSVFSSWTFLFSSMLGAAGALVLSLWVARKRLLLGESIAISVLGFVLLGTLATGSTPGLDAVRTFFDGLIGGWSDLLSATAPVLPSAKLRVLPFVVAWVSALVGAELLRSVRLPAFPVVGPVVGLMLTALFSAESRWIAIGQGVGFVIGALVLAQLQQLIFRSADGTRSLAVGDRSWGVGALSLVATLLVVAVLSPALGALLGVNQDDRFDLRDYQDINWDPLSAPNPLVDLKASFRDDRALTVAFTIDVIEGERPARLRVASFSSYDGQAWRVADRVNALAAFRPIDRALPSMVPDGDQQTSTYEITIDQLGSHWLPTVGIPTRIESLFPVRFNTGTETLASPRELTTNAQYRIEGVARPELDDLSSSFLSLTPSSGAVPVTSGSALAAFTEIVRSDSRGGFDEVLALQRRTRTFFYDRDDTSPGHTISQLNDFLTESPSNGFEEQYAAAAGIVARNLGAQTRVTVGYLVEPQRWTGQTAEVLHQDVGAWIEVNVEDLGWLPIDVTPDRRQQKPEEELGPDSREFADAEPPSQADANSESELSPPVAAEPPPEEQPRSPEQDQLAPPPAEEPAPSSSFRVPRLAILVLVYGALPLLLIGGALFLIVWGKSRRRRRRKSAPMAATRVAGAWQELGDRLSEAGHSLRHDQAPEEAVEALLAEPDLPVADAATEIRQLSDRVDRAAFHPEAPTDQDADGAWDECGAAVACLQENQSRSERIKSRYNPAPLLKR